MFLGLLSHEFYQDPFIYRDMLKMNYDISCHQDKDTSDHMSVKTRYPVRRGQEHKKVNGIFRASMTSAKSGRLHRLLGPFVLCVFLVGDSCGIELDWVSLHAPTPYDACRRSHCESR